MGNPGAGAADLAPRMSLGDFLVAYLRRLGVTHLFGLPGDLVLGLFHRFGQDRDLEIVTLSHEPAIGFAADGYARSTRRLGVVCVTYGAGGYNIVNSIAGAYAEQVPLLVVSGGPGEAEQKIAGVHHQAKHIEGQCRVFDEVTCTAKIIDEPATAAREIHASIGTILREGRPGYLEIHRDMVDVEIDVPRDIRDETHLGIRPVSDDRKLAEAVQEAASRLREAKRPMLIGGVELFRERAEDDFLRLAEKLGVPVSASVLARGVFPMDHPLHMGIYMGPFSPPEIEERVASSDLILALGTQLTDMNLGATLPQIPREHSIWAASERVNISFHQYTEVALGDFVRGLAEETLPHWNERVTYHDNLERKNRPGEEPLSVNDMLVTVNDFLAEAPGYDVIAEAGDMLFGGLEIRVPSPGIYMAQGYYASMGFGIPAAIGAQIGTGRRPLILCGDGAFQMTGAEISHAPKRGLNPIVLLVNNEGWSIFRPVTPRQELLEIPNWPYADMAAGWGGLGLRASNASELREALREAHASHQFALIECTIPRDDLSPISRRYIEASAKKARAGGDEE